MQNAGPGPDGFTDFQQRELADRIRALTPWQLRRQQPAPQGGGRPTPYPAGSALWRQDWRRLPP
jgi:hypothetical protein